MAQSFNEQIKNKTNEELIEILLNTGQYQSEYISLTEIEAKKRDLPLEKVYLEREENNREKDSELRKPKVTFLIPFLFTSALIVLPIFLVSDVYWKLDILPALLLALPLTLMFATLPCLVIGYSYRNKKETLSNGERIRSYSKGTILWSSIMIVIGWIGFLLFALGVISALFIN